MAALKPEDIISFGIKLDTRAALQEYVAFQKKIKKGQQQAAKDAEAISKAGVKAMKDLEKSTEGVTKQQEKLLGNATATLDVQEKTVESMGQLRRRLREIESSSERASGEKRRSLEEELRTTQEILEERERIADASTRFQGLSGFSRRLSKEAEKLGEHIKEPLQSFLQKDAKGLIAGLSTVSGKAAAFTSKRLSGMLQSGSTSLWSAGSRRMAGRDKDKGNVGLGGKAGGLALKGLSGIMKGFSVVLKTLNSIGPILSLIGSGLMGIIRMFFDADAMVKEFNAGIVQSAATVGFLDRRTGSLKTTLDGVRDAAMDFTFNNEWGITKEQHTAVMNTLTQEGVALDKLAARTDGTREGMAKLSQQLVATGVAYSRSLGVPISEISQLQAEMMTEMGASIGMTEQAFALIAKGANESGIAANKFFAMIRGVSQDMSMWNMRMEDSVALLSKLNKVMNPRNAQKFLQDATNAMKGMGRGQKLEMAMFAGQKATMDRVKKDLDRQTTSLAEKLAEKTGGSAEDIQAKFEQGGYAGIKSLIDKLPDDIQGAVADEAITLQLRRSQASKGFYGSAMATAGLGLGASLEHRISALTSLSGTTDLEDAIGMLGTEAGMAEKLGFSDEDVLQMGKLQIALETQRKELLAQGKDAKEVSEMGYADLIDSMSDQLKESLKAAGDEKSMDEQIRDLAKEQGKLTASFQQKLENFVDWFMSTFYDLMLGIWDTILGIPGIGDAGKKARLAAGGRLEEGSVMRGVSLKDEHEVRGTITSAAFYKEFSSLLGSASERDSKVLTLEADLEKAQATSVDEAASKEDQEKARASILEITKQLAPLYEQQSALKSSKKALDTVFKKEDYATALQMDTGFSFSSRGSREAFERALGKGEGFETAARKAGASEEQIAVAFDKLVFSGNLPALITGFGSVEEALQDLGDESPQAAASAASATAGSPVPAGAPPAAAAAAAAGKPAPGVDTAKEAQAVAADTRDVAVDSHDEAIATRTATERTVKEIKKGIKLDPSFMKSEFAGEMEKATLAALRVALYEYYLYSGVEDRTHVAAAFRAGGGLTSGLEQLTSGVGVEGQGPDAVLANMLTPNARGGVVTSVAGGVARVAAQGEGLASIGVGERILPAGAGGTNISFSVNGIGGQDLARLIEAKIVDGVREYKRREKLY